MIKWPRASGFPQVVVNVLGQVIHQKHTKRHLGCSACNPGLQRSETGGFNMKVASVARCTYNSTVNTWMFENFHGINNQPASLMEVDVFNVLIME